ncbi:PorP/SprF family type IX secretion system membrane protein [Pedobacter nyackensis]|uniref:Type IX secretion system membrane protein, PorP/SprF family n=1 Tax=Pedobacter nyackensis TaxID=475255 RepID=A0A1W2ASH1_9SPHI|nr:type IX secretion system membrane protein PorP/SprF [Pedobacter nyackensis]SMC63148.1 type IX secretion system membrane protein, PorP/SprF family [Pedobacter nyackensis]
MKRAIYLILIQLVWTVCCFAQQRPQYTQYVFNNYLLNPAISGIENYADVKVGYRKQWAGIDNAPQTSFITAHWNLGSDYLWRNALSLPDKGDDPMSRNYMQNYTSSPAHHGMGITAVYDEVGPLSRLDANLTYAYHLQLNNTYNLSVGVAAGVSRIGLDVNALTFEDQSRIDPSISNGIASQLKPDLGLGAWLYGGRLFVGVSVQQILQQKLSFTGDRNNTMGKEVPHFFVTAGYKLFIDNEISATPSIMVKQVSPVPASIDVNLKVSFKDRFWLGGSYRKDDSYAAMAGINISKLINLTYAYDFTTSALNQVSNGSHEIVLGLQLNNVYEVFSTTRMW